jgi:hypothetical protein
MIDTDRDMMQYNAEIAREAGLNEAIMQRAEANVERFRGRVAKRASYFQAAWKFTWRLQNINRIIIWL